MIISFDYSELFGQLVDTTEGKSQIFEQAISKVVNEAVNPQDLVLFPGLLNDREPCDVVDLLLDIQLTK